MNHRPWHKVSPASALPPAGEAGAERQFKLTLTGLKGRASAEPTGFIEGTVAEVCRHFLTPIETDDKTTVPLFSPALLRDDRPAGQSASAEISLLSGQVVVLDLDKETQPQVDQCRAALHASGFVFVMHPTHSHTPSAPRWRVIVFLSENASLSRCARLWAGLGALTGTCGDPCAAKPAQRFHMPSKGHGATDWPQTIVGVGRLATSDELEALAPAVTVPALPRVIPIVRADRADRRDRDFYALAPGCVVSAKFRDGFALSYSDWRAMVGVMKFCTGGEALWHELSAKDPRYDRNEAQAQWNGWQGAGPTRCGTFSQCGGCEHNGSLSTAVQLSDMANAPDPKPKSNDPTAITRALAADGMMSVMDTGGCLRFVESRTDKAGRTVKTVMYAGTESAKDAIRAACVRAGGTSPSVQAIDAAESSMRHKAKQSGEKVPVYLRVGQSDGCIWLDLGPGRIARIAAEGVTLVDDAGAGAPLFQRASGAGELPDPFTGASAREALVFALRELQGLGLSARDALVVFVLLVEWLRTDTPHPPLEVVGPAGCGKSAVLDFMVMLIDPPGDGGRVTTSTDAKDIAATAAQRYLLTLDNASGFDKAIANLLCIVSTGGTVHVRQLYAQRDTLALHLHRPVGITAVSPACTQPDLMNRTVRIELPARQGGYLAEAELRARWTAARGRMLGAVLTCLAGGLRELPRVAAAGQWRHRLVDFDQMGESVCAAAGLKAGTFKESVGAMREAMARRTASGDVFLMALLAALRKLAEKPTHTELPALRTLRSASDVASVGTGDRDGQPWCWVVVRAGTLRPLVQPVEGIAYGRDNPMPATDRAFLDAVRRVQPLLAGLGIETGERTSGTRVFIQFDFLPRSVADV